MHRGALRVKFNGTLRVVASRAVSDQVIREDPAGAVVVRAWRGTETSAVSKYLLLTYLLSS
jgi:hypothetical protein